MMQMFDPYTTQGVNFGTQKRKPQTLFTSVGIHVWYIYLGLVDFYGKCR